MTGIDAKTVGMWLQHARKAAGKSQQDAAEFAGIARTTLVAIEKGQRRVQPSELAKLAAFYGRQVADLLRPQAPDQVFGVQLRAALAPHDDVTTELAPVANEFQRLCEDYLELERLTKSEVARRYPGEHPVPRSDVEHVAEELALEERRRLGLGDGPIGNLREVLEQEMGARIFYIEMPSRVDAMFAFTDQLGPCIAVNSRHPEERRRTSIAHEWGHFLTARRQPDVQVENRFERVPVLERFANAFARSFLMPESGVGRRFNEAKRTRGGTARVADVLTLAHYYFVSFQTMAQRLEELRLINSGTYEALRHQHFAVREGQAILGLTERVVSQAMLPARYVYLAVQAYRDEILSEGRLAHFLRVHRVDARKLVQEAS